MQNDKAQAERISDPFSTLWGGNSEIQGDGEDLKNVFRGLFNTILSEADKNVSPDDQVGKTFLNIFKSIVPAVLGQPGEKVQEQWKHRYPGVLFKGIYF